MNEGIDTGDMLLKRVVPIEADDTGETLFEKLKIAGASLVGEVLPMIEEGKCIPRKQDDAESTYAKILRKGHGHIQWEANGDAIECLSRGLNPWPSAYTEYKGKTMKIWKAKVMENKADGKPGTISEVTKDAIIVNTGDAQLALLEIQLEGKKRMMVKDFLLGSKIEEGTILGGEV